MISTEKNHLSSARGILVALVLCLSFAVTPGQALATDYFVWGRVYSAASHDPGEEPPINPLTGVPEEQIIGENLLAVVPRNLVEVKIVSADDGSELGSYITRQDGGYLVSFSSSVTDINIRFIVKELATSKTLLESGNTALTNWPTPNIRYLLIDEDLSELGGGGGAITTKSPLSGLYTGIFTRVGKIEVATEVGGVPTELIDSATGQATVPAEVSSDLNIPAYQDSPFGGNLYLFGAFSAYLYNPSAPPDNPEIFYKIQIENVDTSTTEYMDDPLVKTKYTVDFTTGTVNTERVTLGPNDGDGLPNCIVAGQPVCYRLTPISSGSNVFWSFPDLLALWRTGSLNGTVVLHLKVEGLASPSDYQPTDLRLHLDNLPPVARIEPLQTGDPSPRVYTPNPVDTGIGGDLTGALLGSFPDDYGGTGDPTCAILNLESPLEQKKYLAFKLTAYHANGFMRNWQFRYRRNDTGYATHVGKAFDGTGMADYGSPQVTSTQTDQHGFQDMYLYMNSGHLQPGGGTDLGSCGYRFEIRATTRTTDGYHYLHYRWDEDIHYLLR